MRRALLVALAVVALTPATVLAPPAHAAPGVVLAAGSKYVPGTVVVAQGTGATLVNLDGFAHDVIGEGDQFRSVAVGQGETAVIEGVELLPAGTYNFFCSFHEEMLGQLEVV